MAGLGTISGDRVTVIVVAIYAQVLSTAVANIPDGLTFISIAIRHLKLDSPDNQRIQRCWKVAIVPV